MRTALELKRFIEQKIDQTRQLIQELENNSSCIFSPAKVALRFEDNNEFDEDDWMKPDKDDEFEYESEDWTVF